MSRNRIYTPYALKSLSLRNRIVMAPMCQYAVEAKDGTPNDWHYVHYVSRAIGGTGLIIMEMTNIEPDGRISDFCLGSLVKTNRFQPIDASSQRCISMAPRSAFRSLMPAAKPHMHFHQLVLRTSPSTAITIRRAH